MTREAIDTLTKAEKLSRAMDNVISGGRSFNKQLAAQIRTELRGLDKEKAEMQKALRDVEEWWLADGMKDSLGAPHCIFTVRALLAKGDAP